MAKQLCPECGCHIGVDTYEQNGVVYCCRHCATGGQCECGCCEIEDNEEQPSG